MIRAAKSLISFHIKQRRFSYVIRYRFMLREGSRKEQTLILHTHTHTHTHTRFRVVPERLTKYFS
jgi:hypothetical protein